MIKNIIFDLGNVLLNFKPDQFLEKYVQESEKISTFTSKVILTETWLNLDRGLISVEVAIAQFKEKYPEEIEMINLFFTHWMDMFTPIQKNVNVAKELKSKGYKLYILSNFILEPCTYVNEKLDFFQWFDGAVYSYQIHHIKPEIEIYQHLISIYQLNPEESVFLDDHQECLDPARKLGFQIIQVNQDTDIKRELRKINVHI